MRISRLSLNGFGRFDSEDIDFTDGYNVVLGPNEAGKSTIQTAILASLYGLTQKEKEPFKPWFPTDTFELNLVYETQDGEAYEIHRDFKNKKSYLKRVGSRSTGNKTPGRILKKVEEHLGFGDSAIFNNTVFVRQNEMTMLTKDSDRNKIKDMISGLVTGSLETPATKALADIQQKIVELEGGPRSRKKGRLFKLSTLIDENRQELQTVKERFRTREDVSEKVESQKGDLKAKRQEFKDLGSKLEKIRAKKEIEGKRRETKEKLDDLNNKISKLDETATQLRFYDEELKGYSSFEELSGEFKEEFIRQNIRKDEKEKTRERIEKQLGDLETQETTTKKGNPSYLGLGLVIALISLFLTPINSLAYIGAILGITIACLYFVLKKEIVDGHNSALLSDLQSRIKAARGETESAQETINAILDEASVENPTEFKLKLERYTELKRKRGGLQDVIGTLLGDEDLDSLKVKRQGIYDELAILESQYKNYKEINIPDTEILDMEERYKALKNEIPVLKESYDRNIGGKDVLEKDEIDPVAIEEEIDFYEREYKRAIHKNKALKIALEVLTETAAEVQQEFAPKLSEIASEYLSKITNGKYSKASVDENLNIKVFSPELNDYVVPEALSTGTRDQIYFSLRIATAQILSQNKRPPIILDDPFHSFDKGRLENTIHMLKEISKGTQVILFSHDFWYEKDASDPIYVQ